MEIRVPKRDPVQCYEKDFMEDNIYPLLIEFQLF